MPFKDPEKAKAYQKEYNIIHREEISLRQKRYVTENKEKVAAKKHEDYLKNQDKYLLYGRQYYYQNQEQLLEEKRQYIQDNKPAILAKNKIRKALQLKRLPLWADKQEITRIYKEKPEGHHIDHIVPLQGENVSGLHVEYNLQYLTPEDNLQKGNKFPYMDYK